MARKSRRMAKRPARRRKGARKSRAKTVKIVIAGPRNQRRRKMTKTVRF